MQQLLVVLQPVIRVYQALVKLCAREEERCGTMVHCS